MHPSGYERALGELHQLSHSLFVALRRQFPVWDGMSVRFDRIDDLDRIAIEEEHLVAATLLCTQLLHRVTAAPDDAHPRHVVTLCTIVDQALTTLLEESPPAAGTAEIGQAHGRLCDIGMDLAVLADPGDPGYSEWSGRPRPS
jgi:hypothetical protein